MSQPNRSSNHWHWTPEYEDRFWSKVDRKADPKECWPWKASGIRDGYGLTGGAPFGQRLMPAHRVAYMLTHANEELPAMVLHSCDNPGCCNPLHLVAGDQASNMADMKAKGRARGGRKGGAWLKLSPQQGKDMAAMHAAGFSVRGLAILFGLTPPGVRYRLKLAAEGRDVRVRRTHYLGN